MPGRRGPRVDAQELKRLRLNAGLTQRRLGEASGVAGSYLSRLEAGTRRWPAPRIVHSIAKALGIEAEDLWADEQDQVPA